MSAAPGRETGLLLDGLSCAGCVNRVERALRAKPGVLEATINYTNHRALVRYDPKALDEADLVGEVEALGYRAVPYDPTLLDRPAHATAREALIRVLVAAFLAGNVMWIAAALYIGGYEGLDPEVRRTLRWLAIALSVPAISWCALPFWRGAWSGLRRRELTVDVPITIGIATSFVVSVVGTLAETEHLYMDSAAVIVFLILLGRTLERGARARATGAVDSLMDLSPDTAVRIATEGPVRVAVDSLSRGDHVRVAAGENIPVDGRILCGSSELDEALITGESTPVLRRVGDRVVGGSTNLLGELDIEVTEPSATGTLARLTELLERAQLARPRVQQLADRVAAVFAPSVLVLAGATALAWWWAGAAPLEIAITAAAVLIVACPCALGLATPAAVTAAIGRAAQLGILIKSGATLERCASTVAVVLDKTGTLTRGSFAIEEIVVAGPAALQDAEDAVLQAAALAEGASTHPLAVAIREAAESRGLDCEAALERTTLPGRGVEARVGPGATNVLRVGARAWVESTGARPDAALAEAADKLAERGLSLAWVARGSRVIGLIAGSDPVRDDARRAVARLEHMGIETVLVSGDHFAAVRLAAQRAGIRDFAAGVAPEDKVARVESLRAAHSAADAVVVVGDGINDAAALAAADVGVAIAQGSDVTVHAADAVVGGSRLEAVPDLIALSRTTLRRIRENLGFAVGYNLVAIPLAATGILEPLHAAIAMSLSSLIVTGNSVRLLRWKAPA